MLRIDRQNRYLMLTSQFIDDFTRHHHSLLIGQRNVFTGFNSPECRPQPGITHHSGQNNVNGSGLTHLFYGTAPAYTLMGKFGASRKRGRYWVLAITTTSGSKVLACLIRALRCCWLSGYTGIHPDAPDHSSAWVPDQLIKYNNFFYMITSAGIHQKTI